MQCFLNMAAFIYIFSCVCNIWDLSSWSHKESDMTERLNRTEEEGMGSISGPGTKIPNVANTAKYINKCSHIQEALH